jgi:tetratricopeptide (TPR) repeat protein
MFLRSAILAAVVGVAAPSSQSNDPRQAFARANVLYAQGRYPEAAAAYEAVLAAEGALAEAHFFLANAYDNQVPPGQPRAAQADRLLDAARAHYEAAATLLTGPDQHTLRIRALQYLTALHGVDKLNRPSDAEPVARRLIGLLDPADPAGYLALAKVYEGTGRLEDAARILGEAQAALPGSVGLWQESAFFHNRTGRFDDAIAALEHVAALEPRSARAAYQIAVLCEEKVRKDVALAPDAAQRYLRQAHDALDRALQLQPDYFEALTYRNLVLRQQARLEADPQRRAALIAEADRVQGQAIDLRARQVRPPRP